MPVVVPVMRRARLLVPVTLAALAGTLLLAPASASAKSANASRPSTRASKTTASAAPPRAPRAAAAKTARTTATPKVASSTKAGVLATAKAVPKMKPAPPCFHDVALVQRGAEASTFSLTRCDGSPAPLAIERLSVLARPNASAAPPVNVAALAKRPTADLAPGVRRMDTRLVERLQAVVDHFGRGTGATKGAPRARIVLVSGYRPASVGSFHAHGRALDFRVDGVANEELVAFCKTLRDTGCGYYPNSSFVHLDVREPGTGHVQWIDGSGPGESPHYVSAWPPPPSSSPARTGAADAVSPVIALDPEAMPTAVDEHPSMPSLPNASEDDADSAPESDVLGPPMEAEAPGETNALPTFVAPKRADGEGPSERPAPLP